MNKYEVMAQEILNSIGGTGNVGEFTNCMTRLRVSIKDHGQIDEVGLKKVEGVLGVVDDETYQIILGPGVVSKVAEEFGKLIQRGSVNDSGEGTKIQESTDIKSELKKKNNTPFKNFLRKIGNIFIPLIPALVGAGIINGIAGLLNNLITSGNAADWVVTLQPILGVIGSAFFGYLTIFAGINAAKEFGGTPSLGGAVAAIIVAPAVANISYIYPFFGEIKLNAGQGGIIGAILAAGLLSVLEKYLRKRVPAAIDIIVTPTLSLLVVGLLTVFFLMPVSGIISQGIGDVTIWLLAHGGPLAGFVLASLFLPLVMFGLHQALIPIHAELITQVGYTALLPILAMAGAGQVGSAIAIYVKLNHNSRLRNMIKGALPVGFLGIGEPLIYGVSLPLGRPFITACLGGGFGGALLGLFAMTERFVGTVAIGPSGLVLIPLLKGPMGFGATVLVYLSGLVISYIAGFVLTYFFGFTKQMLVEHNKEE
ncbi:PTS transporter subunit EIIC [Paenibacillus monticola]|uniref:PTS sugar transporter subunit IIC n=1 Tax=Paenibacillus monticola TaxID=2666075 RepID=A0A7X2L435_9BACL|nr:PTS transporter subunit EIIC [Paenibacillus monticola]MRN56632.1 PTS sugar transporter subunit IIC [Paenibacillus monticola]